MVSSPCHKWSVIKKTDGWYYEYCEWTDDYYEWTNAYYEWENEFYELKNEYFEWKKSTTSDHASNTIA